MLKKLPSYLSISILGLSSCSQPTIKTDAPLQSYSYKKTSPEYSDRTLKIDLELLRGDINRYNKLGIISDNSRDFYMQCSKDIINDEMPLENKKLMYVQLSLWIKGEKRLYDKIRYEEFKSKMSELERIIRKLESESKTCIPRN